MVYVVKDKADFDSQLVAAGDKVVVVDFYATWCGPCKMIAPKLEQYSNDFANTAVVLKVNVDECEELAAYFNISSMPTFVFIKNGEVIDEFSGANAENLLKHFVKHTS